MGTIYFEDEFVEARQAANNTLNAFDKLCESVNAKERSSLIAANRPKMSQLAEELRVLNDMLIHDD